MRRFISLALAAMVIVSLVSCNEDRNTQPNEPPKKEEVEKEEVTKEEVKKDAKKEEECEKIPDPPPCER